MGYGGLGWGGGWGGGVVGWGCGGGEDMCVWEGGSGVVGRTLGASVDRFGGDDHQVLAKLIGPRVEHRPGLDARVRPRRVIRKDGSVMELERHRAVLASAVDERCDSVLLGGIRHIEDISADSPGRHDRRSRGAILGGAQEPAERQQAGRKRWWRVLEAPVAGAERRRGAGRQLIFQKRSLSRGFHSWRQSRSSVLCDKLAHPQLSAGEEA